MNMGQRLLREFISLTYDPKVLREDAEKNGGRMTLKGIFQKAECLNQNGRIYPRQILQREVENYMKAVRENRAMGCLDHPDSSIVELNDVSHIIRELWWEGNDLMGRMEVLDTPKGKILRTLLESGVMVGVSSRGVGSTSKDEARGAEVVQDDFSIVCWDAVSEPSTPGAYPMMEGKEARVVMTRADRIYRALNAIVMRDR